MNDLYLETTSLLLASWCARLDAHFEATMALMQRHGSTTSGPSTSSVLASGSHDFRLAQLLESQAGTGRHAATARQAARIAELEAEIDDLQRELRNFAIAQERNREVIGKLGAELAAEKRKEAVDTEFRTNSEYLRNVMVQFASSDSRPARLRMIPVLTQLLHLSPAEVSSIERAA